MVQMLVNTFHCATKVVYSGVYLCVYFWYTIHIPCVLIFQKCAYVYSKNPQVSIVFTNHRGIRT